MLMVVFRQLCVVLFLSSLIHQLLRPWLCGRRWLFSIEMGIQRLHLEGDALEILNAVQTPESSWSCYGQLIDDTRIQLR